MSKLSDEKFEQVRKRMLKNKNKSYLDTIYDYLDLVGKKPWCGRIGLKWLLSLESQRELANTASFIVSSPMGFEYAAAFEYNFDVALEHGLSSGLHDIGRGLVYNDVNKYICHWLVSFLGSYLGFKVFGPI